MQFYRNNIDSSSDVSVVVKASAAGSKIQMGIEDTNVLELETTTALTLKDFQKIYGEYIIVGFEYGGEILFQSTTSTSSSEKKETIVAALKWVDGTYSTHSLSLSALSSI